MDLMNTSREAPMTNDAQRRWRGGSHAMLPVPTQVSAPQIMSAQQRCTPPQLNSADWGSPDEVWSSVCAKDDRLPRRHAVFEKNQSITKDMRRSLLDWMLEVCADKHLHREVFHLSVDYVDRYLGKKSGVLSSELQLIGTAALVVASKVEEIYPPSADDFAFYTDGYCNGARVVKMEEHLLDALSWDCSPITSLNWMTLYLQLMNSNSEATHQQPSHPLPHMSGPRVGANQTVSSDSFSVEFLYSHLSMSDPNGVPDPGGTIPHYLRDDFIRLAGVLDLLLFDEQCFAFKYSELAAAVVLSSFEPPNLMEQVTGYKREQLIPAVKFVKPFLEVCERYETSGSPIPFFNNSVLVEDRHNIQLYAYRPLKRFAEIQRQAMENAAREAENKERKKSRVRKRQHD